MSKKSLLQEAIAEAKQVREAAIQSAYKQLEESLTPSIKEMLANKLEEEVELEEEEIEESNSGFTEVKPKKTVKEEEGEEENSEETEEPAEGEEEEAASEEEETSEEPVEDPEGEEASEEEADDETPISDMTLGDLKNLISDLATQIAGPAAPAPEGDMGADMDAGDVEGMGDEETPIEDPAAAMEDPTGEEAPAEEDDEIDISEILKELEAEEKNRKVVDPSNTQNRESNDDSELAEVKAELEESVKVVKNLKATLSEVNLLNSKLLYTTRMMSESNLSESQKASVIRSFDKAKTPNEVKLIYKTLKESVQKGKKNVVTEGRVRRGLASKAAGKATKVPVLAESDNMVKRFQQLAGIIE